MRNLLSTRRLHVELARANQHKSEFLDSMSHELRTQLSAILGFSELLLSDTTEPVRRRADRRKFLAQINSSGRYLLDLISDILDLAKIEAGHTVLRIENVVIADVVRSVLSAMEPLAVKKAIRLEADVAAAGTVPADLGKLKQMLVNLVSNAVKFTPAGGRVTISVQRLAEAVEISVTDTGIGIDDSDRKHLFEEFRQLDSEPRAPAARDRAWGWRSPSASSSSMEAGSPSSASWGRAASSHSACPWPPAPRKSRPRVRSFDKFQRDSHSRGIDGERGISPSS